MLQKRREDLLDNNIPILGNIGSAVRSYLGTGCIHSVSNVRLCHTALVFVAREGLFMEVYGVCRDYHCIRQYDKPIESFECSPVDILSNQCG